MYEPDCSLPTFRTAYDVGTTSSGITLATGYQLGPATLVERQEADPREAGTLVISRKSTDSRAGCQVAKDPTPEAPKRLTE